MDPAERIAQLERELVEQWWMNHAEHCGHSWPHPSGAFCGWPLPAILDPKRLKHLGLGQFEYSTGLSDDGKDVD
jgi:hypothetical protein